ncbi:MAG: hypothetical protein KF774_05520 [Planctomyces sp.]|nr:hypothetical protein [Planctomyces sp.]
MQQYVYRSDRVTLGCGSLILIALIVLFFSGRGVRELETEVKELRKSVVELRDSVDDLKREVRKLQR